MSDGVREAAVLPELPDTNVYKLCADSHEFMTALRDDSERCHTSLRVQFSTFEGDASGEAVAKLMMRTARRGVDVRFLVDHYSDVIANDILPGIPHRRRELADERARTTALLARLRHAGVEVRRTAPVGSHYRYLLYRDHKKMVVIDGRVAFVGGLNVSDHNFSWHDFMVRIDGPIVSALAQDFESTWSGMRNVLAAPVDADADGARDDFVVNHAPGREAIGVEVLRMIDGAERSILLASPSLLGDAVERALLNAANRGVQISILAPARHNRAIFRVWIAETFRRLAHPNIAIHRFEGVEGMTHAKLLVVDDGRATFGSFNFFELEATTQKELNIFTSNRELIVALRRYFEQAVATSTVHAPPSRSFGRFTYVLTQTLVARATRRLLRNPAWKTQYA